MKLFKKKSSFLFIFITAVSVCIIFFNNQFFVKNNFFGATSNDDSEKITNFKQGYQSVTRIVDGDTIWIGKGENTKKIRLLCVDTPETTGKKQHPLGFKARAFTQKLLKGTNVRLQRDPALKDRDQFGRFLRYVFTENNLNVNVAIVASGWSAYYTKHGKSSLYHQEFISAEQAAMKSKLGIWNDSLFLSGGYLKNAKGK